MQQLTPLLAWPLVASGRSKEPSTGPRGLWPCLGEVLLAGSTSMGAAQSWAGASASPSTSGECLANCRPQWSKSIAAVQSWAKIQHTAAHQVDPQEPQDSGLLVSALLLQQAGWCCCMAA